MRDSDFNLNDSFWSVNFLEIICRARTELKFIDFYWNSLISMHGGNLTPSAHIDKNLLEIHWFEILRMDNVMMNDVIIFRSEEMAVTLQLAKETYLKMKLLQEPTPTNEPHSTRRTHFRYSLIPATCDPFWFSSLNL